MRTRLERRSEIFFISNGAIPNAMNRGMQMKDPRNTHRMNFSAQGLKNLPANGSVTLPEPMACIPAAIAPLA